jgi:GAF domain-containing protein
MSTVTANFFEEAYSQALDMLEKGQSQQAILAYLATQAEMASGPGATASILLLDEKGLLRNGASPRLPADYIKAINGLKPNPLVGTCAAAAATGQVVMTPDFYADDKWAELRHLPLALGFVGAWSMPIKNPNTQEVLGTFGTYFREKRQPTAEEQKGIERLAAAAARVLSHS